MRQYLPNGFSRPGYLRNVLVPLLKRGGATITALGVLTIGALVASCGGGGGGDGGGGSSLAVSGVAATGSPLAGTVTLKDSSSARSEKTTDIADNGSFSIDVSGMTAPFVLKATGTVGGVSRTMFSFAAAPGVTNVNPLTNAAMANAAGVDDPAELFDKSDPATLDKIKSSMPNTMPASVTTLRSKLKPMLDEFSAGAVNPVNDSVAADHQGLDDLFDNVKITLANGTLTITNADTGAVLFTAQVSDLDHGNLSDNDGDMPKHGRPRPAAPTGVTAVGGDAQVTVSWDPVADATSYDLFFTTTKSTSKSEAADEEDRGDGDAKQRIKNVTSPFVVTGLAASTTYSFIVRARIDGRKGPFSDPVTATTTGTTTTTGATTTTTTGATTSTTVGATTSTTAGGGTTSTAPTTTTSTTTTTPTTTTTTSTTTTTLAINGVALYNTNCANCHGPLATSTHHGASAAQISAGIAGVTSMRNSILATNGGVALTQAQIAAISVALQ